MGTWFATLFGSLAELIASWMAQKTVFATSITVGFLALTAAFLASITAMENQLAYSLPAWMVGLGYLIPNNGALCFSICVSARVARWVYDYHREVLKTAASV